MISYGINPICLTALYRNMMAVCHVVVSLGSMDCILKFFNFCWFCGTGKL